MLQNGRTDLSATTSASPLTFCSPGVFNKLYILICWKVLHVFIDTNDTEKIRESIIYAVRPQWRSVDILEEV